MIDEISALNDPDNKLSQEKRDREKRTIMTEQTPPICPWCKKDHGKDNPLSWDQFKEVWTCPSHGKFDESQVKTGV